MRQDGSSQDLSKKIHNNNDARKAAHTFAEGRKSLEDLLYFCFTNNVKTHNCCAGHEDTVSRGYISFNLNDEFTRKAIKYINTKLETPDEISINETCNQILTEGIYCNPGTEDAIFTDVLEHLQEYISKKDVEINEDNETNRQIEDRLERKNNPKYSKSGFWDAMGANIKFFQVQDATQIVKSEIKEENNPNKDNNEIGENK